MPLDVSSAFALTMFSWFCLNAAEFNARRCSVKFTSEEDVITSVNYFVVGRGREEVGDVRAKNTNPLSGKHFHKKFTACFADQREQNEIIVEGERGDPKCIRRRNFASLLITANFRLHRGRRTKCNCPSCQSTISAWGGRQINGFFSRHGRCQWELNPKISYPLVEDNLIMPSINFGDLSPRRTDLNK